MGCLKGANCLAKKVDVAWKDIDPVKLKNVWNRWQFDLSLISDEEGENRLFKSKGGKLFRAPPDRAEIIEDGLNEEETDLDFLDGPEIGDYY